MVDILDINVHYIGAKICLLVDILYCCTLSVHCLTMFTNHEQHPLRRYLTCTFGLGCASDVAWSLYK